MSELDRPRLEGTVAVRDGRRLCFAEFGAPGRRRRLDPRHAGRPSPDPRRGAGLRRGARPAHHRRRPAGHRLVDPAPLRQRPRLDRRPRARCSTSSASRRCRLIGLSGGGPYALAAGAAMPDRVHGVGVLGGVAPTQGPDAIDGALIVLAAYAAPVLRAPGSRSGSSWRSASGSSGRSPGRSWTSTPPSSRLVTRSCWAAGVPRDVPRRPAQRLPLQTSARCSPTSSCSPSRGASRPADVQVPVHWWHGDSDHIVRTPTACTWRTAAARALHHDGRRVPPRRPRGRDRGAQPADGARASLDRPVIRDITTRRAVRAPRTGATRPCRSQWAHKFTRAPPGHHDRSLLHNPRPLGKAYLDAGARRRHGERRLRQRPRGAFSTSTRRLPRCARTSSGPSAAYSVSPLSLEWTPQPAQSGTYRAEYSWSATPAPPPPSPRPCAAGTTSASR